MLLNPLSLMLQYFSNPMMLEEGSSFEYSITLILDVKTLSFLLITLLPCLIAHPRHLQHNQNYI
jgi:hypothetical protein